LAELQKGLASAEHQAFGEALAAGDAYKKENYDEEK